MRPALLLLVVITFSFVLSAQHSNGYLFAGPGSVSPGGGSLLHVGGGAEFVFLRRAGAGFEVGALGPTRSFSDALAVLSANGYGHFGNDRFDPFLTAGYSRLQRTGGMNAFNYGVGMNYWFRRHLGIRVEFRDHVVREYATNHLWSIRFGLAF